MTNEIVIYKAKLATAAKMSLVADWSVEYIIYIYMNFNMISNGILLDVSSSSK